MSFQILPSDPSWLAKAASYIGFHEQPGNQGIGEFIDLAGVGSEGDPWCAIFANAMLRASGYAGTGSALAKSFSHDANYVKIDQPKRGAIAVFDRGGSSGHVGFWTEQGILGGNESDQVMVERISMPLVGYYWPAGAAVQPQPGQTPSYRLIQLGDTGPEVVQAQQLLGVDADGDFGGATKAAVETFQAAHGLTVDGQIGDDTWTALLAKPPVPPVVVTPGLNPSAAAPFTEVFKEIQRLVILQSGIPQELAAFKKSIFADMVDIGDRLTALGHKIDAFQFTTTSQLPPVIDQKPTLPSPIPPQPSAWINKDIICTVFGGTSDPNKSAYDGHLLSDTEPGCSLPYRFIGKRPLVAATNKSTGVTVVVPIVDVGPWYDGRSGWPVDSYWESHTRPRAEGDARTNKAAIDFLPATAKALGIDGKGKVDWHFVDQTPQPTKGNIVNSPLTTTAGTGAIGAAIIGLITMFTTGHFDFQTALTDAGIILAGFVGIFAKDHNAA